MYIHGHIVQVTVILHEWYFIAPLTVSLKIKFATTNS